MPYEANTGLGVFNQYGPRNTGGSIGTERSNNSLQTMSIELTGEMLNSSYMPNYVVPSGAKIVRATLRVNEIFVVSASGTVAIGGTAPSTNGVVLTEAQLEALGTKDVSSVAIGTWATASATGTTAAQRVAKLITGTVTSGSGRATLVVEYLNLAK